MKTMLFNPYTGTPRHPSDISSDPEGILLLDPDEPVRAAPTAVEPLFAGVIAQHPGLREEIAAEFEAWLTKSPDARFWNTSDAMFAAFVSGRASKGTK